MFDLTCEESPLTMVCASTIALHCSTSSRDLFHKFSLSISLSLSHIHTTSTFHSLHQLFYFNTQHDQVSPPKKKCLPRSIFPTSYSLFRKWEVEIPYLPNKYIFWKSKLLLSKRLFTCQPTGNFFSSNYPWTTAFKPNPNLLSYKLCNKLLQNSVAYNSNDLLSLLVCLSRGWSGTTGTACLCSTMSEIIKGWGWNNLKPCSCTCL